MHTPPFLERGEKEGIEKQRRKQSRLGRTEGPVQAALQFGLTRGGFFSPGKMSASIQDDVEMQGKGESGDFEKKCRLPASRGGKCCLAFGVFGVVYTSVLLIRLATANYGEECPALADDIPTFQEWDASPGNYEYTDCNGTSPVAPWSMIRTNGEHNSYKLKPNPEAIAFGLNVFVGPWDYEKPTLTKQLQAGFRHFELDVHFGKDKERMMSFHLPALDDESLCYCLEDCFSEIKTWSDANPTHVPITIEFEVKTGHVLESWRDTLTPPVEDTLDNIDDLIRHVWRADRDRVFTPADLLRDSGLDSLPQAIESRGWPTLESMRGKILFAMYKSTGWDVNEFKKDGGGSALEGRAAFVFGDEQDLANQEKHVAFIKMDDPVPADQKALVKRGYIIRTRANGINQEPQDYAETVEKAVQGGAQLVTMDSDTKQVWDDAFGANGAAAICSTDFAPNFCPTVPCPSNADLAI